jgi:hypothetical protein
LVVEANPIVVPDEAAVVVNCTEVGTVNVIKSPESTPEPIGTELKVTVVEVIPTMNV